MKIGLFGGTFDPIHRGHVALARAALDRCHLNRIYFVPASVPPHKQQQALSPFAHRYAMLALATAQERAFIPSLLEAPDELATGVSGRERPPKPNFTIDNFSLCRRHFCDSAFDGTMRAFTSRSSRTLNCPSNLIGHDPPNNRPENGVGMFQQWTGAALGGGRQR